MDAACKVLGHRTALNSLNTHPLQSLGEPADKQRWLEKRHVSYQGQYVSYNIILLLLDKVRVAIEFPTMLQASGPGKNAGDGVGAGRSSLKPDLRIKLRALNLHNYYTLFIFHS